MLAADKGYYSKQKRADLRKRGIRPQIPKRVWKTKKNRARPIKISVPRFQQERCFAWYQRKYRRLVVRSYVYDGLRLRTTATERREGDIALSPMPTT